MDYVPSSAFLSSAILLAATVCFKKSMTPPDSRPNERTQIEMPWRVIPLRTAVLMALTTNYMVCVHLLLEVSAIWVSNSIPPSSSHSPSRSIARVCPLIEPSATRSIYPSHRLPSSAVIPLGLIIAASLLRLSCHRQLGKMFTWEASIQKEHKLITSGPYRFVRHPAYTGFFSNVIGYIWFLWTPGTYARECLIGPTFLPTQMTIGKTVAFAYPLLWTLLYADTVSYLVRHSLAEDAMLRREFGKQWDEWARKVPWRILPFVF